MAKIRNVSGLALDVPRPFGYQHVAEGEVIEVGDDELYSYTLQSTTWAPSGKDAQALHEKAEKTAPAPDAEPAPPVSTTEKES